MGASSLRRTSTATPAPAVAGSTLAAPAAAPQRAGNAAVQERLDLGGGAPTRADGLSDALDALGELGAVVLDALPLHEAVRLAIRAGRAAWAEAWVLAQAPEDLLVHADALLRAGFARAWPVGFGAEVDLAGSAALAGKVGADARLGLARTAAGVSLAYAGGVEGGVTLGLGATLAGAHDDAALGASLDGDLLGDLHLDATWDVPVADLLRHLAGHHPRSLNELLLGRSGALGGPLVPLLSSLAMRTTPSSWSLADRVSVDGTASDGLVGVSGDDASVRADAGLKIGRAGDTAFVEASVGGSAGVRSDNKLFEALRKVGMPELSLAGGQRLRIRACGAAEDVRALRVEALAFVVGVTTEHGDRAVEERFESPDWGATLRWIGALFDPLDRLLGADGPAVSAEALPDVSLRRTATRTVEDVRTIADPGVVAELVDLVTPDRHAFLTCDHDAVLTAEVVVPVAAVAAGLRGAALPVGPEGVEARVLEMERVIAGAWTGATCIAPAGTPALDLAAARTHVTLPRVEATVSWSARAGLGGEVGAAAGVEAGVRGGLALSQRGALSPAIDAEQRRALFGG